MVYEFRQSVHGRRYLYNILSSEFSSCLKLMSICKSCFRMCSVGNDVINLYVFLSVRCFRHYVMSLSVSIITIPKFFVLV